MRVTLCWLLVLAAACGGSSPQPTSPANTAASTATPATAATVPDDDPKVACANHPDEFGPYVLTADQAARRYGMTATKLADAPTTKTRAIEVCGIAAQQEWLLARSCADGSKPFSSRDKISGSRRGNVGEGGRCGAIIDLYIAKCPEATYEVHIDMYMCGPDEQF